MLAAFQTSAGGKFYSIAVFTVLLFEVYKSAQKSAVFRVHSPFLWVATLVFGVSGAVTHKITPLGESN